MKATCSRKVGPNKEEQPLEDQIVSDTESEKPVSLSDTSASSIDKMATTATLRELAAPKLVVQPLSISYPALDRPLKLNSGFLNLLPKFHRLPGEDPYRFINECIITCSTMQLEGIPEDHIRLRAFPFALQDRAKD